ncbi:MAG: PAS domain S-box protein [Magnetovibrio sp.]|nr:PAS domain S-box protein [Magnetovibrio sp.]
MRKSLGLRFLSAMIPIIGLLIAGLFVSFDYFTSNIIDELSEQFAGQQAAFDRGRTLQPLLQEVALAKKLARSPAIIDWALNEGDPKVDARGVAELESFRDSFRDRSYFFVVNKSRHYYFNDAQKSYSGKQLRYTVSPKDHRDLWYFATIQSPNQCQLNVNNDEKLGLTKVWVNCLIKVDNKVVGIVGTGIDLSKFLRSVLNTHQPGVENMFIDGDGAIQAYQDELSIDFSTITKSADQKKTLFRLLNNQKDQSSLKALLEKIKQTPDKIETTYLNINGQKKLLGIAYLQEIGWFNVTVITPKIWALGKNFIPLASLTLLGMLLTSFFAAIILHRIVLRRIGRLDVAIGKVKEKDYELELSDDTSDEIGRLTASFVEMAGVIHKERQELEKTVNKRTHELKEAKECAELYLDVAGSIIVALDVQAQVTLINNQGCLILGMEKQDILNKNWIDNFISDDQKDDARTTYQEIMSSERGFVERIEHEIIDKNGNKHLISWHNTLLRDDFGKPSGTLSSGVNITERRKGEIELFDAKNVAEKANLAKTRFLASASHDLRQPLQAVNLFLFALDAKVQKAENKDIISSIQASVGSLGKLLDSLLDISRLEAGLIEPHKQKFPIAPLMDRIANEYAEIFADAKSKVGIHFVKTKAIVCTDPILLETILRNLVSNAFKSAARGKILIGCRHQGDHISLEVWDNGCGIAEDKLTEIFGEFVQIGNEGRDRSKGLGLGLSIVEKLASLLHHDVHVRSWEGKGSVFSIELPLFYGDFVYPEIPETALIKLTTKASIFIVEDEPDIRLSLSIVLKEMGYEVDAVCGYDFHESARLISKRGSAPDLIVADYRLQNNLTGIDAIHFFNEAYKESIPAILLTGDTAPDRLIEANISGFTILHKPILAEELVKEIEQTLLSVKRSSQCLEI